MHYHTIQFHRLLLIACLALMQLFVPLVHAHTGDSHQTGVHVHIPGTDPDNETTVLTADPGIEIGIGTMRRENVSITPGPDNPPLCLSVPDAPAFSAPGVSAAALASSPTASHNPDASPPRGPPAALLC